MRGKKYRMYELLFYVDERIIFILATFALLMTSCMAVKYCDAFKTILPILVTISLLLILHYTVFRRQPSDNHQFLLIANFNSGFYREMIMNVMLFFPLGLSFPYVISSYKYSVLIAFLLSLAIEIWQYLAGTGLAQGTDVIMNTLGVMIGGLSYIYIEKRNQKEKALGRV